MKVEFTPSPRKGKKWRATFSNSKGLVHHTDFGSQGQSDFTLHKDEQRKQRLLHRFSKPI